MIIGLERTGGFGGIRLSKKVDTAELSKADALVIEKLVTKVIGNDCCKSNKVCDQFQYKLRIDDRIIEVTDPNADAAQLMHYLLDY